MAADLESFFRSQHENEQRFLGNMASIIEKYNIPDDSDIIDLADLSIVRDTGTIKNSRTRSFGHARLPYQKRRSGDKTTFGDLTLQKDISPTQASVCSQSSVKSQNFEEVLNRTFGTEFEPEFVMRYKRDPEASRAQITALEGIKKKIERDILGSPEPSDAETISSESSSSESEEDGDLEIVETTTEPPTETSTASPSFPVDSSGTSTTYKDCEADGSGDFDVFSDRHGAFLQGQNRIVDKRKSFTVKHRLLHSRAFKHAEVKTDGSSSDEEVADCKSLDDSSDDSSASGPSSSTRKRRPSDPKSHASDSATKLKQKYKYAMDRKTRLRKYKPKVTAPSITCLHNVDQKACPECSSMSNQPRVERLESPEAKGPAVMTVYNVTRRSVELYSPPPSDHRQQDVTLNRSCDPEDASASMSDDEVNELQTIDHETDSDHTVQHTRDYRQLVGLTEPQQEELSDTDVEPSKVEERSTPNGKNSNTFGSTYVISKSENQRKIIQPAKRITPLLVSPAFHKNILNSNEVNIQHCNPPKSNVRERNMTQNEITTGLYKSVGSTHRNEQIASEQKGTNTNSDKNPRKICNVSNDGKQDGSATKEIFLGALCDQTVQKDGHWAPGAKSFNIALSDAGSCSEVDNETTLTEMDNDLSSCGESGNEADVSEWDENQPIGDLGGPGTFRQLHSETARTPKRTEIPLDISSPKFNGPVDKDSCTHSPDTVKSVTPKRNKDTFTKFVETAKSATPKHRVHLDVKGFLSLPSSPAATVRHHEILTPSPSHLKQIFDKLKASVDEEKSVPNNDPSLSRTPSSSKTDKPTVFRTPSTVPKSKMRKRLDLNQNENVIVTLDDSSDNESHNGNFEGESNKGKNEHVTESVKEPLRERQENYVQDSEHRGKETKHFPPSAGKRRKFQSFDQLFKEMGTSSSNKRTFNENEAKLSSVELGGSKLTDLPPNVKRATETERREVTEKLLSNKARLEQEMVIVNTNPSTRSKESDLRAVDNKKSRAETPYRRKTEQKNQDKLGEQQGIQTSPRITSTPRKVNSPMPNLLDISIIQGPEAPVNKQMKMMKHSTGRTKSADPTKLQKSYKSSDEWLKSAQHSKVETNSSDFNVQFNEKETERVSSTEAPRYGNVGNGKSKSKDYDNQSVFRNPNCSPKLANTVAAREQQIASPSTPRTSRKSDQTASSSGTPLSRTPKGSNSRERKKSARTPKGTSGSPYSKWDYGSPRSLLRRKEPEPMYINESDSSDGDSTVQSETLNSTTSSSTTASAAAATSGTPNRSGIYTSLFSESPSSSRKRKHSSNTSQPTPEHHNKKHRHTEPTECDNFSSQPSYRKNPLHALQFTSREKSSRTTRDQEDSSNISSEGCATLGNTQNEILWEDDHENSKEKPRKFFSSGGVQDRMAKTTSIHVNHSKGVRTISPVVKGDEDRNDAQSNYTSLRQKLLRKEARIVLSPVMTNLSERLRVKYGEEDEMEARGTASSKYDLQKMSDQKYKNSGGVKLFQNRTHLTMSEGHSNLTDSGINSTVDISETALNGNISGRNFRSPVSSPARVKPHAETERVTTAKSRSKNNTENISSTKFYARNNDINIEETSPIFSSSSSSNSRKPKNIFKLPSSGLNRIPRANVSPAASEIVTSRFKQSRHGSGVSLQNSLYVTGNCAEDGISPAKMYQSVPAREASVCEGKGKCNKPVCFICIV